MPFFHYDQNNSGGRFTFDKEHGLSCEVIIEADSPEEADSILISRGGYFNGCADGRDCRCCGDRWSRAYGNGDPVPTIHGRPISANTYRSRWKGFAPEGTPEGYIHYKGQGGIVPVTLVIDPTAS